VIGYHRFSPVLSFVDKIYEAITLKATMMLLYLSW